ncbi:hypothetical protein [Nocardiopsis algeriensis]|uniref:Integral membrane protein n=1 Tax=Nocardiopsis algeriensis TaxID=1478215 RepID=A0A841IPJ9_9ACTN|nr:hypothetical protein [Nocardiopsis algeriensis]MBB6118271.1 hypothetical protein [Nocardiopsis algeriensis]
MSEHVGPLGSRGTEPPAASPPSSAVSSEASRMCSCGPGLPPNPDRGAEDEIVPGSAENQLDSVELRVHGVSGGQAEELLDVEPAMRVGGDRLAGFFRWRREADTETVPGVRREIFAWGNLTSGRSSRALWLLLLPFMLVNVAYWMRPGCQDRPVAGLGKIADNTYGAAVRLLALTLTSLITLAVAGIGMDLVAWQCAAGLGQECARVRPWLSFLASHSSALSATGPALLVGALMPATVVAVLWRLSRRTAADYEVVTAAAPPVHSREAPLSDPDFWRNSEIMARLRSAHVSVAIGTVVILLLLPALRYDLARREQFPGTLPELLGAAVEPWVAGSLLVVLLAAVVTASALSVLVPGVDPRWNVRADRFCRVLRDAALLLAAVAAGYTLWPRPGWEAVGQLPGHSVLLGTLFAAQSGLVLLALVAAAVLHTTERAPEGAAMYGLAGPATAALGALLGSAFSAAVVYQGSLWLSGCGPLTPDGAACLPLSPPAAYSWVQLAIALEGAIAVLVLAFLALRLRRGTRAHLLQVTREYERSARDLRTWHIAEARALGRMTEVLPAVLAALLLPAAALAGLVLYSALSGNLAADGPVPAAGGALGVAQGVVSVLIGAGSLLGGASLVALAWIGHGAYRDRPTRQAVGALWDVGTFWPRVAHPLAPPSYAERAVPQLVARVARMTREGTRVVLSGHSQGSVLAAATVWQLPDDCLGRVALVTHGSPLDRLYARYFPAYFGPVPFADLQGRLADWRNLWRTTDAIAGPVRVRSGPGGTGTVGPDESLPDPRNYDAPPGEARRPEIMGHSCYTDDPAYAEALRESLDSLEEAYQGP